MAETGEGMSEERADLSVTVTDKMLSSIKEIASRLNVSETTVRRLIAAGLPVSQPMGRRGKVYIRDRILIEWLEAKKRDEVKEKALRGEGL